MYLYLHIPFCKSKCAYCDFFSVPLKFFDLNAAELGCIRPLVPDAYIEALLHEAEFRQKLYNINSWQTVYIGGGTPSLLMPVQLKRLLDGLFALCPPVKNAEITLEINPADILDINTAAETSMFCPHMRSNYLSACSFAGINRISCGIQCLNDAALQKAQRRSTAADARCALGLLKNWKKQNGTKFSVDMIAGLPELCFDDFIGGLQEIISFEPDHISVYSLSIEEGTPFHRQIADKSLLYDDEESDKQWLAGRDLLERSGYPQYEVSNFAPKSCKSKHNSAYWRMDDYLGLGAGAVSTIKNKRFSNTDDIHAYTAFWDRERKIMPPANICACENLSIEDARFEFIMMGLRTLEGLNAQEFFKRFSLPVENIIGETFCRWKKQGLACRSKTHYKLTRHGLLFLNRFLQEL